MFGFMCSGQAYWQRPDKSIILIDDDKELPEEVKSDLNDVLMEIKRELDIKEYNEEFILQLMMVGLTEESSRVVAEEYLKRCKGYKRMFIKLIAVFGVDNFKEIVSKMEKNKR